jgi:GNAT superfamily N-acetyltransferase
VPSPADARQSLLKLTVRGHQVFEPLQQQSRDEATALLAPLAHTQRDKLMAALGTVHELLDPPSQKHRTVILRDPRPGDFGWVVSVNGALYAEEYGWGAGFEALVARVVADFAGPGTDPERERAWIADAGGRRAGCVLCVRGDAPGDAKLRLLLVEPWARGLGAGGALVDACIAFARDAGYHRLTLWTNAPLVAARRLYDRRGFTLVAEEPHADWGVPLLGQVLALGL